MAVRRAAPRRVLRELADHRVVVGHVGGEDAAQGKGANNKPRGLRNIFLLRFRKYMFGKYVLAAF